MSVSISEPPTACPCILARTCKISPPEEGALVPSITSSFESANSPRVTEASVSTSPSSAFVMLDHEVPTPVSVALTSLPSK